MTPAEYVQLKAFARIDGALTALLWIVSFGCFIGGLVSPMLTLVGVAVGLASLFFVSKRIRLFRDRVLDGIISRWRAWGYTVYVFFYASLLLALAQYAYFAYLDQGFLVHSMEQVLGMEESKATLEAYGMTQVMSESLAQLGQMRPIDLAVNTLTSNIMLGFVIGVSIALLVRTAPNKRNK